MTRNAASTSKQEAPARAAADVDGPPGMTAVDAAEKVLGLYLAPGRWPSDAARTRFMRSGDLERALALYECGMADDPREPAYPWNLASALDRMGLPHLALVYLQRAIRTAEAVGDDEWADASAYLALADIALKAGNPDLAMLCIERARALDPTVPVERYIRRVRSSSPDPPTHRPQSNRDSARKGKAVEHLVAATCMIASGFELNVSTNLVDDEGVDLVFHRRDSPVTLSVQVKSRSWAASTMQRAATFRAQVRESTFAVRPDLFLLFVAVDAAFADYGPVWLVASEAFGDRTTVNSRGLRRFVASASPASADQWSEFRLERSQLPPRLLELLREREA